VINECTDLGVRNVFLYIVEMIAQRNMKSFFLCNGNETQEIMKPTGAHDFCFRRFIGMFCTRKLGIFLCASGQ